jgi:hypothetical protein
LHHDEAIEVAGRLRYEWAARRRPFVHPLCTPAGHVLTVDAPADHPWHHGLWFTIKYVNGENFWEEYDDYGVLRHNGEPSVTVTDADVSIEGALDWIRPDRSSVALRERRTWRYRPLDDAAYALDLVTTLVPSVDTTFDRTPFTTWGGYGGLTFRGRPDLIDTRLLSSDGRAHDRRLGEAGRWLDCSGTIDGAPVGVALLDHPSNPHHPTPWYASTKADTYGSEGWSNFVNAAFLWNGPFEVRADDALSLRYRVIVHDGVLDAAALDAAWDAWAAGS